MKIPRRLSLLSFLFVLLFSSLAPAAAPPLSPTVIAPVRETIHHAEGVVWGDVKKVLAGSLKQQDYQTLPLKEFLFLLGAGSIDNPQDTGEMLAVGGKAYVKTTDELLGFPVLSSPEKISTPFAVGIKKNKGPGAVYYLKSPEGLSVSELYAYLLPKAQGRAGVIIYGRWKSLATTALRRAPLDNLPIMTEKNRARYFHPQEFLWDKTALACGLVISRDSVSPPQRPLVERMFYVNFADVRPNGNDVLEHTHVLILGENQNKAVAEEELQALLAGKESASTDVRHLLSQSLLYEGIIYLYPLASFHEFAPAP